jgi:hypothetical protein
MAPGSSSATRGIDDPVVEHARLSIGCPSQPATSPPSASPPGTTSDGTAPIPKDPRAGATCGLQPTVWSASSGGIRSSAEDEPLAVGEHGHIQRWIAEAAKVKLIEEREVEVVRRRPESRNVRPEQLNGGLDGAPEIGTDGLCHWKTPRTNERRASCRDGRSSVRIALPVTEVLGQRCKRGACGSRPGGSGPRPGRRTGGVLLPTEPEGELREVGVGNPLVRSQDEVLGDPPAGLCNRGVALDVRAQSGAHSRERRLPGRLNAARKVPSVTVAAGSAPVKLQERNEPGAGRVPPARSTSGAVRVWRPPVACRLPARPHPPGGRWRDRRSQPRAQGPAGPKPRRAPSLSSPATSTLCPVPDPARPLRQKCDQMLHRASCQTSFAIRAAQCPATSAFPSASDASDDHSPSRIAETSSTIAGVLDTTVR